MSDKILIQVDGIVTEADDVQVEEILEIRARFDKIAFEKQTMHDARTSALNKLELLGLTSQEIAALVGVNTLDIESQ